MSVECDEAPVKRVIDAIGDDRIVFSTFLELPISEESKRMILWDNCSVYDGLRS